MFSNKTGNKLINTTHRRALRAMLNDFSLSYEEMLNLSGHSKIHDKNLLLLALEVFKSINGVNPSFMNDFYSFKKSTHNLRQGSLLLLPPQLGTNSWVFRSILIWNNLPKLIKEETSINKFKSSLADLKLYCNCKICR